MTVTLRPNQIAAVDAVEDGYRAGLQRPLVDSCVGSGKSLSMAELARRAWARGERSIILAHREELVAQNAAACVKMGLQVGINCAKLGERTWRAPVISAMIHSVYNNPNLFGHVDNVPTDECHLIPHAQSGIYREFLRGFPNSRQPGFSGTVFRLQGGSLVEGEGAPFQKVVYTYPIIQGIHDGYLVPAFSAPAADKIDVTKLKTNAGDFTGSSQDAQMMALMDSHIAQMVAGGADRKAWLIFEASQKAALAMTQRLNEWGIPAACIIDKTKNRKEILEAFRAGKLRALVNVEALTTGFDDPRIDLVCFRRRTKSIGLYIQMAGRGLRTIGGHIDLSIAAGKSDCLFFDFAGLIDEHGPLDFIRPKLNAIKFVSCDHCAARVPSAAMRCWQCDEPMQKICPGCIKPIDRGTLICPLCEHDMRLGDGTPVERKVKLLETPSGAALIAAFAPATARAGGWIPIRKTFMHNDVPTLLDQNGDAWELPPEMAAHAVDARWVRGEGGNVEALLKRNGSSRSVAIQVNRNGQAMPVPMPLAA